MDFPNRSLTVAWENYVSKTGDDISYTLYKKVCMVFNRKVMERIILYQETFHFGHNLATLSLVRVKNKYKRPRPNWPESLKRKEEIIASGKIPYSKQNPEGERWFVPFLQKYYLMFFWKKSFVVIQNRSAYNFKAARGKNGPKALLARSLEEGRVSVESFKIKQ